MAIRVRITEFRSPADQTVNIMQLAQEEHDLIIAIGPENTDHLRRAAIRFEDSQFALIDGAVQLSNVFSVVFDPSQSDFVAGALCALVSTGSSIAYVGEAGATGHADWLRGVRNARPEVGVWTIEAAEGPVGIETALETGVDLFYVALDPVPKFVLSFASGPVPRIICRSEGPAALWPDRLVAGRVMDTESAVYDVVERLVGGTLNEGNGGPGVAQGEWLLPELPEKWNVSSVEERLAEVLRRQGAISRGGLPP
jgi:basic membrane lipoprotein Med (substrate-binding protein (PBP1-ABC) superfamily)